MPLLVKTTKTNAQQVGHKENVAKNASLLIFPIFILYLLTLPVL